ncbi:hypothetical protein EHF33_09930 [Deinococcus psychrotolerans]|uniref:Uncharacterized protein n=1 Tax=Deinococcus psychrotolerans TaxID=2489213 RepID=A0A3G8YDU0_9DEIO|nr:hypothetical protein [Deinococcus psychrotolerans]AZI43020.1 hypothetical protein EHF33_09930 [Deinococcus psychrotolerans]
MARIVFAFLVTCWLIQTLLECIFYGVLSTVLTLASFVFTGKETVTSPASIFRSASWTLGFGVVLTVLCWPLLLNQFKSVGIVHKLILILFGSALSLAVAGFLSYSHLDAVTPDQLFIAFVGALVLALLVCLLALIRAWRSRAQ